jgi:uncharacterized protein YkwD
VQLRHTILLAAALGTLLAIALRPEQPVGAAPAPAPDAPGCPRSGALPRPADIEDTRAAVLCLLNAERAKHGLHPLARNLLLELSSQRHSDDMATRKFFSHDTPEGIDPQARIKAAGYPLSWTGENLYMGTNAAASPVEALDGWMNSPGHRENILRPQFTQVGVGVAYSSPKPDDPDPAGVYTTNFGGP